MCNEFTPPLLRFVFYGNEGLCQQHHHQTPCCAHSFLRETSNEKAHERDRDATVHEVHYDLADAGLQTYEVHLKPFDTGSPEQWLKFRAKLDLIMTGNGLTTGPVKHNFTKAVLKGEALQHFANKTAELGNETVANHILCMQAVAERIIPKGALQEQKRHLREV